MASRRGVHPHPRRAALSSVACGGSAWGRTRHSGAGPAKRHGRQAFLQAPLAWVTIQATTPRPRWPAQLWRRSASDLARCADEQVLEQSHRKFASTYATTRAADAEVQIVCSGPAISVDARHDLRSFQATTPPYARSCLPPRPVKGIPDLATGDLRTPISMTPYRRLQTALSCLGTS